MQLSDVLEGNEKFKDWENKNDEQTLVSFVKSRAEEGRQNTSRISHESVWLTNIAALLGYTQVYFNANSRRFENTANNMSTTGRSRLTVNKILPQIQNRAARLVKNKPKYDVRPNSNDSDDKDAARLSLHVLDYVWEMQNLEKKRTEIVMWAQQCGHSYLRVRYDDQLGKPLIDPMSGDVQGYEGDIAVDVVSAFEVFPDPLAKSFEESQWFLVTKVRKLDYFKAHYGEKGAQVQEDQSILLNNQYEARINSLNTNSRGMSGSQYYMKNAATEYVYYEKRSRQYPMGRMIVVAGTVLLEDKPLPVGEIPLVKFDDVVVAGKFYGEAIITHLRPIQEQFNRLYLKRSQWVNQMLAGKYLAPRGSELIKEALDDQSGEVIHYTPVPNASEVKPLEIPQIPAFAYKEEEALQMQLDDISGINQVSRGSLPSASIPAIGMQFLTEQDDTRIGIEVSNHEEGYARLGKLVLQYAQKFYQTPRLIKIGGKSQEYSVESFVGADLQDNTDVVVVRGSTLPGSKTLKRQEVLNLFSSGLLGDPADPKVREKTLQLLEFGDVGEIWQRHALSIKRAKREIDMIEQGVPPEIDELDPHHIILQELENYRLSDKFDSLPDPNKEIFYGVREQHIQYSMELADPSLKFQEEQVQLQEQMAADQMQADQQAMNSPEAPVL